MPQDSKHHYDLDLDNPQVRDVIVEAIRIFARRGRRLRLAEEAAEREGSAGDAPVEYLAPTDMTGKSYEEIVAAVTAKYWVAPVSTSDLTFEREWYIADRARSGMVHYQRHEAKDQSI